MTHSRVVARTGQQLAVSLGILPAGEREIESLPELVELLRSKAAEKQGAEHEIGWVYDDRKTIEVIALRYLTPNGKICFCLKDQGEHHIERFVLMEIAADKIDSIHPAVFTAFCYLDPIAIPTSSCSWDDVDPVKAACQLEVLKSAIRAAPDLNTYLREIEHKDRIIGTIREILGYLPTDK